MHGDSHIHQLASRIKITEKTKRSVLTSPGKSCYVWWGWGWRGGGVEVKQGITIKSYIILICRDRGSSYRLNRKYASTGP